MRLGKFVLWTAIGLSLIFNPIQLSAHPDLESVPIKHSNTGEQENPEMPIAEREPVRTKNLIGFEIPSDWRSREDDLDTGLADFLRSCTWNLYDAERLQYRYKNFIFRITRISTSGARFRLTIKF